MKDDPVPSPFQQRWPLSAWLMSLNLYHCAGGQKQKKAHLILGGKTIFTTRGVQVVPESRFVEGTLKRCPHTLILLLVWMCGGLRLGSDQSSECSPLPQLPVMGNRSQSGAPEAAGFTFSGS